MRNRDEAFLKTKQHSGPADVFSRARVPVKIVTTAVLHGQPDSVAGGPSERLLVGALRKGIGLFLWSFKYLSNFLQKFIRAKWFSQELAWRFSKSQPHCCHVVKVSRNLEDLDVGTALDHAGGQCEAVHSGHDYVGHKQVDVARMLVCNHRGFAVSSLKQSIALAFEHPRDKFSDCTIVVDEEDSGLGMHGASSRGWWAGKYSSMISAGLRFS